MLQAVDEYSTPTSWWLQFCRDYTNLQAHPIKLLQRLSKGTEIFRPDEWRRDPSFVKICATYGDEDEVRRLFRFLRSEHVGAEVVEFHLHLAHFELCTGKPEKCLATLEGANKLNNEAVRKALVEFRLLGTFRLEPLMSGEVGKFVPPMTPMSEATRINSGLNGGFNNGISNTPLTKMNTFLETPLAPLAPPVAKAINEQSSPGSASVPQRSVRMRRLGITGPPKRTMVTGESPSDWTVPQDVEMVIDQPLNSNNNEVSPLNSPTKTAMTMDKESMSLTTISPLMTHTDGGKKKDEDQTTLRSRAVRVNGKSYKVLQLIGRGGSSKVFKVLAPDNSILALKKVGLKNLDEVTLSGYLNEIDLLRALSSSPHIIKLLDCEINKENSNLYMLMEYGEADLGKLLKRTQTGNQLVDLNFIRYMWQQMLSAVQTVHNHKIVHCDLKPANFLLVAGRLKLIDFGISKAIMNDTTNIVRENQVGTVNYMSPEALQESSSSEKGRIKIGRASDVWSLGCILYEMSYGKPPFAQFTLIQRLHKILDSAYEIEFGPCDPILKEVIRSCLQRQSKKRLSLEELLVHPFLIPKSLSLPPDSVVVSRRQIVELMEKFARHIPQLDPAALTEKILTQWQRE